MLDPDPSGTFVTANSSHNYITGAEHNHGKVGCKIVGKHALQGSSQGPKRLDSYRCSQFLTESSPHYPPPSPNDLIFFHDLFMGHLGLLSFRGWGGEYLVRLRFTLYPYTSTLHHPHHSLDQGPCHAP